MSWYNDTVLKARVIKDGGSLNGVQLRSSLVGVVVAISAIACSAEEPSAVLGLYDYRGGGNNVGVSGKLAVVEGCVMVQAGGSAGMLAWPDTVSLSGDDGDLVIVDDSGEEIAEVGDRVLLGGGYLGPHNVTTQDGEPLPEACRDSQIFAIIEANGHQF